MPRVFKKSGFGELWRGGCPMYTYVSKCKNQKELESLLPFPAWGTGNVSLPFLPTVPLLINFTVTFTKKKEFKKHLLL
jgi:hypothetical protein